MKVSPAIAFHFQYHRSNSRKYTFKTNESILSKFATPQANHLNPKPLLSTTFYLTFEPEQTETA